MTRRLASEFPDLLRRAWWLRSGFIRLWPAVAALRRVAEVPRTASPAAHEAIPELMEVAVVDAGRLDGIRRLDLGARAHGVDAVVSCLLVTRQRVGMAQGAIRAFLQQSYPEKELVVVDDDPSDELARWIERLGDPRIACVRPRGGRQALGVLRNLAVARARGEFVAQWDDDDLSHPRRLEVQMAAIRAHALDACFLHRQQVWWPRRGRAALSRHRLWEGSMVCRRALLPCYPAIARGEDTPVTEVAAVRGRIALLDLPGLYTYVVHGSNTFANRHFEYHWRVATARYEGAAYVRWLERLMATVGADELSR